VHIAAGVATLSLANADVSPIAATLIATDGIRVPSVFRTEGAHC
jgi:hypothetical protein